MTRGTILHSPEYLRVSPNLESEREEGDNGAENKFEEIVKISPNLVENTKPHIYESQWTPSKINKKNLSKPMKQKNSESFQKKKTYHIQDNRDQKVFWLLSAAVQARYYKDIFKALKKQKSNQTLPPRILYPAKNPSKWEGEIKTFLDRQKIRKCVTSRPVLIQYMSNQVFQAEGKSFYVEIQIYRKDEGQKLQISGH